MGKTWKESERQIASLLGGERVPITGRARGSAPDIDHGWLSIEVKHRAQLPDWIKTAIDQARASSTPNKLPVTILHQHRKPYKDSVVLIRLEDFVEWFVE